MTLTFDEGKHEYRVDGQVWPPVSEILRSEGLLPNYPPGPYRVRGKQIHKATELIDQGFELELGAEVAGYIESYVGMLKQFPFVWAGSEVRLYHPTLGYCGTPDRVGLDWRGLPCVLDLKSGDTSGKDIRRAIDLQLAAYVGLVLSCPDAKGLLPSGCRRETVLRYTAKLHKNGEPAVPQVSKDPFDFTAWEGFVNVFKWRRLAA